MFLRHGRYYLHVPVAGKPHVQRATGTTNKAVAKRMKAMLDDLHHARRWDALALITSGTATMGALYDAWGAHAVDAFVGRVASPRWATMVDGWLRTLEIGAATKTAYRRQVAAVLPDGARVSDITPGGLRDAFAALPVSSGTRTTYYAAVSGFLHYLVAHDLLAAHPMAEKSKVPRPKKGKPRTTWMTTAEDERLCLGAPSPLREFFALVHSTGAERNAALAMTRADVDLDRWEVHIPGTKTNTRDRHGIPVDAWARPILAPFVRAVLRGPLFPTLTRWVVNRGHVEARQGAGLLGYQLRDARHSVAIRWLVADAVPIWEVGERLGHTDASMAIKVYTKTVLREAAKRLGVDCNVTTTGTHE